MYWIIRWRHIEVTAYDTQEIIRINCELVNGYGADPADIEIIEKK